jgi:hypothetical protein
MHVIIKHVKNKKTGKSLPVILLNSQNVIWEFETEMEAKEMKEIFELNSDSGHIYEVKKI